MSLYDRVPGLGDDNEPEAIIVPENKVDYIWNLTPPGSRFRVKPSKEGAGIEKARQLLQDFHQDYDTSTGLLSSLRGNRELDALPLSFEMWYSLDKLRFYFHTFDDNLEDEMRQVINNAYDKTEVTATSQPAPHIDREGHFISGAQLMLKYGDYLPIKTPHPDYTDQDYKNTQTDHPDPFRSDPLARLGTELIGNETEEIWLQILFKPAPDNWDKGGLTGNGVHDIAENLRQNKVVGIIDIKQREPSQAELDAADWIQTMASRSAYHVQIRVFASAPDPEQATRRVKRICNKLKSIYQLDLGQHKQQFHPHYYDQENMWDMAMAGAGRDPTAGEPILLTEPELSGLIHLPTKDSLNSPDVDWARKGLGGDVPGEGPRKKPGGGSDRNMGLGEQSDTGREEHSDPADEFDIDEDEDEDEDDYEATDSQTDTGFSDGTDTDFTDPTADSDRSYQNGPFGGPDPTGTDPTDRRDRSKDESKGLGRIDPGASKDANEDDSEDESKGLGQIDPDATADESETSSTASESDFTEKKTDSNDQSSDSEGSASSSHTRNDSGQAQAGHEESHSNTTQSTQREDTDNQTSQSQPTVLGGGGEETTDDAEEEPIEDPIDIIDENTTVQPPLPQSKFDYTEVDVETERIREAKQTDYREGFELKSHGADGNTYVGKHIREDIFEEHYYDPEYPIWLGYNRHDVDGFRGVPMEKHSWFKHHVVFGQTGTGKSTYLNNLMVQVAWKGYGFVFIDPKGDGVQQLLRQLPPHRLEDVIWIEPGSSHDKVVGINFLSANEELEGNEYDKDVGSIIDDLRSVLEGSDYWGPKMNGIVSNFARAMIRSKRPYTLVDMYEVLNNENRREDFADNVADEGFTFIYEYTEQIADMDQDEVDPVVRRIQDWIENPITRNVIAHREGTIDLQQAVENGRIILVKNTIDSGDIKRMISTGIMRRVWSAIKARESIPEEERTPFFTFIDEFDDVASPNMAINKMLSKARSGKMGVTLCNQNPSQIDEDTRSQMFGNAQTLSSFKVTEPDDAYLISKRFDDQIGDEEMMDLPRWSIYTQISVMGEEGPRLSETLDPDTFPDYPPIRSADGAEDVIRYSLEKYGVEKYNDQTITTDMILAGRGQDEATIAKYLESIWQRDIQTGDPVQKHCNLTDLFEIRMAGDSIEQLPTGLRVPAPAITIHADVEDLVELDGVEVIPKESNTNEITEDTAIEAYEISSSDLELEVELTETGKELVLDQESRETDSNPQHREMVKRGFKWFCEMGYVPTIVDQEANTSQSDGLAYPPIEVDDKRVKNYKQYIDRLEDEFPHVFAFSEGQELTLEAESTTAEVPGRVLTNFKRAYDEDRKCVFLVKDGRLDGKDLEYYANRIHGQLTDPPFVRKRQASGVRVFYTKDELVDLSQTEDETATDDAQVFPVMQPDSRAIWVEDPADDGEERKDELVLFDGISEDANQKGKIAKHEITNASTNAFDDWARYDVHEDEYVVYPNLGHQERYDTLSELKDNWTIVSQPFVPEYEFEEAMPTEDDYEIIILPDEEHADDTTPLIYDGEDTAPLLESPSMVDDDDESPEQADDSEPANDGSSIPDELPERTLREINNYDWWRELWVKLDADSATADVQSAPPSVTDNLYERSEVEDGMVNYMAIPPDETTPIFNTANTHDILVETSSGYRLTDRDSMPDLMDVDTDSTSQTTDQAESQTADQATSDSAETMDGAEDEPEAVGPEDFKQRSFWEGIWESVDVSQENPITRRELKGILKVDDRVHDADADSAPDKATDRGVLITEDDDCYLGPSDYWIKIWEETGFDIDEPLTKRLITAGLMNVHNVAKEKIDERIRSGINNGHIYKQEDEYYLRTDPPSSGGGGGRGDDDGPDSPDDGSTSPDSEGDDGSTPAGDGTSAPPDAPLEEADPDTVREGGSGGSDGEQSINDTPPEERKRDEDHGLVDDIPVVEEASASRNHHSEQGIEDEQTHFDQGQDTSDTGTADAAPPPEDLEDQYRTSTDEAGNDTDGSGSEITENAIEVEEDTSESDASTQPSGADTGESAGDETEQPTDPKSDGHPDNSATGSDNTSATTTSHQSDIENPYGLSSDETGLDPNDHPVGFADAHPEEVRPQACLEVAITIFHDRATDKIEVHDGECDHAVCAEFQARIKDLSDANSELLPYQDNCLKPKTAKEYFTGTGPRTGDGQAINSDWFDFRGWSDQTFEDKLLGWAPSVDPTDDSTDDTWVDELLEAGFTKADIVSTGLLVPPKSYEPFEQTPSRPAEAETDATEDPGDGQATTSNEDQSAKSESEIVGEYEPTDEAPDLRPEWRGRYVFPYFDQDGNVVYAMSRATGSSGDAHPADHQMQGNRGAKYSKLSKSRSYTYLEEPIYGIETLEPEKPVIIAEGMADAIAAHDIGIPAISPVTTQFKKSHRQELIDLLKDHSTQKNAVYIINDAERASIDTRIMDEPELREWWTKEGHDAVKQDAIPDQDGKTKADQASPYDPEKLDEVLTIQYPPPGLKGALEIATYLYHNGITTYVVDLPRIGVDKVDLDDYIMDKWMTFSQPVNVPQYIPIEDARDIELPDDPEDDEIVAQDISDAPPARFETHDPETDELIWHGGNANSAYLESDDEDEGDETEPHPSLTTATPTIHGFETVRVDREAFVEAHPEIVGKLNISHRIRPVEQTNPHLKGTDHTSPFAPVAYHPEAHPDYDDDDHADYDFEADGRGFNPDFDPEDMDGGSGGNRSQLHDLKLVDLLPPEYTAGYRGTNPLGHHGGERPYTENYYKIYEPDNAREYKYKVNYNAYLHILCLIGERSPDDPHGSLSNREMFLCWKWAKENGYIPEDDPVPRKGLFWVAAEAGIATEDDHVFIPIEDDKTEQYEEKPDEDDTQTFRALKAEDYNATLAYIQEEYDLNPGRNFMNIDSSNSTQKDSLADFAGQAITQDTHLLQFARNMLTVDDSVDEPQDSDDRLRDTPVYQLYKYWCDLNHVEPIETKNQFGQQLQDHLDIYYGSVWFSSDQTTKRGYRGVRFSDQGQQFKSLIESSDDHSIKD